MAQNTPAVLGPVESSVRLLPDCGHGWVHPRADGVKARCGGPALCPMCGIDAQRAADETRDVMRHAAMHGGNVIERLQFALQRLADAADAVGVARFDTDDNPPEVLELQAATHAARLVLGA